MKIEDIFNAYFDARKNKRNTRSQLRFEMNLEENLIQLYQEIIQRKYQVGRSMCFIINDPVKREVFAASFRDRVVHHLLCNYILPVLDSSFISDSYSCRKGKGTLYGIKRIEHHIRSCSDNYTKKCYVLKMDIRGYFMNIDRALLFDMLMKYLTKKGCPEMELVTYLLRLIVFNDPTQGCYIKGSRDDWDGLPPSKSLFHSSAGLGLPIGNLTSQLFSNVYLSFLDDYVKRTLKQKHYGRYVDDFYIIHSSKEYLLLLVPIISRFLHQTLGLTLHPKKVYLQPVSNGVSFLGAYIKPYRVYPVNRTVGKVRTRMDTIFRKEQDIYKIRAVVNSYLGYFGHFKSFHYRENFAQQYKWLFQYGYYQGRYDKYIIKSEQKASPSLRAK